MTTFSPTPAPASTPDHPVMKPLTSLRAGETGVIRETRLEADDAALLRAMGLCLNATVRIFRVGEPCVVAVGGVSQNCKCGGMCRVGLARPLAERIFVELRPSHP